MPTPERAARKHMATLWETATIAQGGSDDHGGRKFHNPMEIKVRWQHGRVKGRDAQGNVSTYAASVIVGQKIREGSIMRLGEVIDYPGTAITETDMELMIVARYDEVPDIRGRGVTRVVDLERRHDQHIEIV